MTVGPTTTWSLPCERVHDDRKKVAFGRQQPLEIPDRDVLPLLRVEHKIVGPPDVVPVFILGLEIELHLCIEGERIAVAREPGDQVVIAEQPRLGDEVHVDFVVEVRRTVVPDLVGLPGIGFPVVVHPREAAVKVLEQRPVRAEKLVLTIVRPVAVKEVETRAAVEPVGVGPAERAVEPGVLQDEEAAAVRIEELPEIGMTRVGRSRINKYAELTIAGRVRVLRPREEIISALAADEVVMPLASEEPVVIGRPAEPVIAEEPVVAAQAEQLIAARSAVHTVAPCGSPKQIIARPAL